MPSIIISESEFEKLSIDYLDKLDNYDVEIKI